MLFRSESESREAERQRPDQQGRDGPFQVQLCSLGMYPCAGIHLNWLASCLRKQPCQCGVWACKEAGGMLTHVDGAFAGVVRQVARMKGVCVWDGPCDCRAGAQAGAQIHNRSLLLLPQKVNEGFDDQEWANHISPQDPSIFIWGPAQTNHELKSGLMSPAPHPQI